MTTNSTAFSWVESYDKEDCPTYITYLKIAMEYFYMAILLADHPLSQQLTQSIYPEKGLFTGLDEKIKSVDDADKYFSKFLADLKVPLPETFKTKAREKAEKDAAEIKKLHQGQKQETADHKKTGP